MSFSDGPPREMGTHYGRPDITDPLYLDDGTVERLLRGDVTADDAPPSYQKVATLLTALTADASATELSGEGEVVDAISRRIAAAASSTDTRSTKMTMKRRLQLAGATLAGGAMLFSGLGAAGALPGAAQGVAADVLGTVGVSVPSPNSHSGTNPDQRGRSADHTSADNTSADNTGADNTGATHAGTDTGANVSGVATDPSTTGIDKGAAVSSEASNGQSQAGQHGSAGAAHPAPSSTPPVGTPPVGTPPVGTPPVTGPPVSTPPVSVPPVPVPPVSTRPVSVPSHP